MEQAEAQVLAKNIWELQQLIQSGHATARARQMLLRAQAQQVAHFEESLGVAEEHRAFILDRDDSRDGVLLVHGSTGTPKEMRDLAEFLHEGGFNVYAMRLPGHLEPGTGGEDIGWQACRAEVEARYQQLSDCCKNVFVVGYSFGANLALQLDVHPAPAGVALIAPALFPKLGFWQRLLLKVGLERLAFLRRPLGWGSEILEAMSSARRQKWWYGTPIWAAICKDDESVDASSLSFVRSRNTHHRSSMHEYDTGGHGFYLGERKREIERSILDFIKTV